MNAHLDITQKLHSKTPVAFVLGDYITSGLGIIRGLGRKNIPVYWLDAHPKNIGFLSRYCIGIHCPSPKNNEQDYIETLLHLGKKLSTKAVLFPVGDVELLAILKQQKKLEPFFSFVQAPIKTTEQLLNKKLFAQILKKNKIPHPQTFLPKDSSDIESIAQKIKYPCIVKPVLSAHFRLDFHTKLFVAQSKQELITGYTQAQQKKHTMMIQEIIPGGAEAMHGFNAYYDHHTTPIGSFMYQRIREWPHGFGNGCLIKRIQQPELEELITPLLKKINYYGIVDVEFKKDSRDGLFKVIEINPRVWMQNSLPTRCGINHAYSAYQDALNLPIDLPDAKQYEDMKWLYMVEDIQSTITSIKNKSFSFTDWIKTYQGTKEYAFYAQDDLRPFMVFCSDLLLSTIKNKKRKIP